KLLAHPEDDRAAIRHDHGIVDEDRIRLSLLRFVVLPDLDAGYPKEGDERVMFLSRGLEVRTPGVTPDLRLRRGERSVRPADEHDPQRSDHALTPEDRGHEGPDPAEVEPLFPFAVEDGLGDDVKNCDRCAVTGRGGRATPRHR